MFSILFTLLTVSVGIIHFCLYSNKSVEAKICTDITFDIVIVLERKLVMFH